MTMSSTCPVCDGPGPLTKEDILPTWLRQQTLDQMRQRGVPSEQLPARVVIRICSPCNKQLGRLLEAPMSELLPRLVHDEHALVVPAEAELLAAWTAKVMLLMALNSWRPGQWGRQHCRAALETIRTVGKPPAGLHVRLGRRWSGLSARGLVGLIPVTMPRYEFFSLSSHGSLVWEVLHLTDGHLPRYRAWSNAHREYLAPVWPPAGGAVRIPTRGVSDVQIDQMRASLTRNRNLREPLADPAHRTFPHSREGFAEWQVN